MAFDWKSLIRSVAPAIGTALGGPLAGMAMQTVSNAVLGKPDGEEAEISAALAGASPGMLLQLKQADNVFKIEIKKLDIDLERLALDDKASARARQIALKDKMPAALAIMLLLMFAGALIALFLVEVPEANRAIVYSLVGTLGTLTIGACVYYHGTSNSSAKKNNAIFSAMPGPPK